MHDGVSSSAKIADKASITRWLYSHIMRALAGRDRVGFWKGSGWGQSNDHWPAADVRPSCDWDNCCANDDAPKTAKYAERCSRVRQMTQNNFEGTENNWVAISCEQGENGRAGSHVVVIDCAVFHHLISALFWKHSALVCFDFHMRFYFHLLTLTFLLESVSNGYTILVLALKFHCHGTQLNYLFLYFFQFVMV